MDIMEKLVEQCEDLKTLIYIKSTLQFVEKGVKVMERKEFLLICQKNAISGEELVTYDGVKYHPISYAIRFDKLGRAKHTAVLHSVKADSVLNVKLEDVEP